MLVELRQLGLHFIHHHYPVNITKVQNTLFIFIVEDQDILDFHLEREFNLFKSDKKQPVLQR